MPADGAISLLNLQTLWPQYSTQYNQFKFNKISIFHLNAITIFCYSIYLFSWFQFTNSFQDQFEQMNKEILSKN